ncbi:hypothetical protein [Paraburkholderia diazotrophica]|uniref:Phage tail fibre repeat-containing protein n=1 Tax=Paraburkholderia diazotrophica TaxID=667676 RepID=A0A1H6QR86_9BURK|nr:hypothetical protein [Paraburkholderia diazotrophica]SEI42727.1 hypothetical protein SAMN05192539_1001328 [Paraburkholderia diazotrophica]
MYRIDDATAATSIPTPETAGTEGYFTEGNPATNTPATKVRGSWLNMIQEELCAILAAAGIARSKTTYNQVNTALQKLYSPVIGTARNVAMSVTAASATATLTADEIVVGAALGGQKYMLPSFNKTINLATTGAGGMDTGTAPVSGWVAIYAIYNPATGVSALLAKNATSVSPTEVYSGANMPNGYTASALVSVWLTNASGQLIPGQLSGRRVSYQSRTEISTTATTAGYTAFAVTGDIPKNAKRVFGYMGVSQSTNGTINLFLAGDSNGCGAQECSLGTAASGNTNSTACSFAVDVFVSQNVYYSIQYSGSGTFTATANFTGYEF